MVVVLLVSQCAQPAPAVENWNADQFAKFHRTLPHGLGAMLGAVRQGYQYLRTAVQCTGSGTAVQPYGVLVLCFKI